MNSAMHKNLLAKGSRFQIANIKIYLLPLEKNEYQSCLSVNITKKAFSQAVERHRIKRKLLEYFRLNRFWIGKYHIFVRYTTRRKKKSVPDNNSKTFDFDILQFDRDFRRIGVFDAKI